MSFWLKTSIFLGSALTGYFISKNYNRCKSIVQRNLFYYGIRTYCQYQILNNKIKLFTIPLYRKIKKILLDEDEKKTYSTIEFFKIKDTDNLNHESLELLSEFNVSPDLMPIKDDDTLIYSEYPGEKLKELITTIAPSTFDFYVLKNNNNEFKDIIIRDFDKMLDVDKINYSKCEFLVLELIQDSNKLSLDLSLKDSSINFNVIGNVINKNFIIYYHFINKIKLDNLNKYEILYVDKNINSNTIREDSEIEFLDQSYKIVEKSTEWESEDENDDQYEVIDSK